MPNMQQHASTYINMPISCIHVCFHSHICQFSDFIANSGKKSPKRNVKSGESRTFPLGPDCLQIFCCQSAFSCLRKPWNHIGTIHVRMQHPWVQGHRITQYGGIFNVYIVYRDPLLKSVVSSPAGG